MNELARMIDQLGRAEQAGDPARSLKILTGFHCSDCGTELVSDRFVLQFAMGLPIRCPLCSNKPTKEGQP